MSAHELAAFLCEDLASEAAPIIAAWITRSKRFQSFAAHHRTKIRKKFRTAKTLEGLRSVLLELEVACQLLMDRRCEVEYERYGQGGVRGPDLTLVFRENIVVNVEVTLLQDTGTEKNQRDDKLINLVGHKLGQMISENCNVLVLACECGSLSVEDVGGAMKRLKGRVEQRDSRLLSKFGFADPSEFFKQFQWLSAVIVWQSLGEEERLWANPQARRPIPTVVAALLTRS